MNNLKLKKFLEKNLLNREITITIVNGEKVRLEGYVTSITDDCEMIGTWGEMNISPFDTFRFSGTYIWDTIYNKMCSKCHNTNYVKCHTLGSDHMSCSKFDNAMDNEYFRLKRVIRDLNQLLIDIKRETFFNKIMGGNYE